MGDVFGIGATVQGAAEAAAAGLNYAAQKDYNEKYLTGVRETNAKNQDLAMYQNAWNREQWRLENAYNSPEQQVQRLLGAGLSQAAAAQSIDGAGNASSLQSAELANQVAPGPLQAPTLDLSKIPSVLALGREFQEYRMKKIEADVAAKTKDLQIDNILTENDAKHVAAQLAWQDFIYRARTNPYSFRKIKYEAESAKFLPDIQKFTAKVQQMNYNAAKQQYGFLEKFNPEQLRKIGEEINGIIQHSAKERQDIAESQSRQGLLGAQQGLVSEQTKTQKEETTAKQIQNCLERHGMPTGFTQRLVALNDEGILSDKQLWPYVYGISSYVRSFGKVFESDPELRSVFINELQPGIGADSKRNLWSIGTGTEAPYWFKQAWKNFSKNISH